MIAVIALGVPGPAPEPMPPAPAQIDASEEFVTLEQDVTSAEPAIQQEVAAEAACSPPPECWTDRDCNRICGKKVGGQCIVVNSCYRECACNAS